MRKTVGLLGLGSVMLAGLLLWFLGREPASLAAPPTVAAAPGAAAQSPAASARPADSAEGMWGRLARATAAADAADAAPAAARSASSADAHSAELQAQRMDAYWCAQGAEDFQRDQAGKSAATAAAEEADTSSAEMAQALQRQMQLTLSDWITRLQQAGDLHSRATALWLARLSTDPAAAASAATLHQLASSSREPYVIALALQRNSDCSVQAGCQALRPALWQEVEPANLQAWLSDPPQAKSQNAPTPEAQEARWAGMAASQYSRSYASELTRRLLSLPVTVAPGLRQLSENAVLMRLSALWTLPAYSGLIAGCDASSHQALRLQQCERIAETLWSGGSDSLLERALTIALAKRMQRAGQAPWADRQRQTEAAKQWSAADAQRMSSPANAAMVFGCAPDAPLRQRLKAEADLGEWGWIQQQMLQTPSAGRGQ